MALDDRLKELNLELPEVAPAGHYAPAVRAGNLLFISGQLPKAAGRLVYKGRLGKDIQVGGIMLGVLQLANDDDSAPGFSQDLTPFTPGMESAIL